MSDLEKWLVETGICLGALQRGIDIGMERGIKKGRHEGRIKAIRQALAAVVQARFPESLKLFKMSAERITDPRALQKVLVEVSTTNDSRVATQAILDLYVKTLKGKRKA